MTGRVLLAALGVGMALAGSSIAASSHAACIPMRSVNGFNAPDDHTVYIRASGNKIFRLDLMNSCLNLSFRNTIGFDNRPTRNWICTPLEATIVTRGNGMRQRCPVEAMRQLTQEEIAAVPRRDLP